MKLTFSFSFGFDIDAKGKPKPKPQPPTQRSQRRFASRKEELDYLCLVAEETER